MSDGVTRSRLRVRSLSLRDFRGVDVLDLDLTGADGEALDLVVLAGANGSGKTAVLEAVLMVLDLPANLLPKDAASGDVSRSASGQSNSRSGLASSNARA